MTSMHLVGVLTDNTTPSSPSMPLFLSQDFRLSASPAVQRNAPLEGRDKRCLVTLRSVRAAPVRR